MVTHAVLYDDQKMGRIEQLRKGCQCLNQSTKDSPDHGPVEELEGGLVGIEEGAPLVPVNLLSFRALQYRTLVAALGFSIVCCGTKATYNLIYNFCTPAKL